MAFSKSLAAQKPLPKVTSWSFSRLSDYNQCPAKFKYKHIDKMKEPPNAAMARGSEIHNLAEGYVKGAGRTLPPELKKFEAEFKMLRKLYKGAKLPMVVEDNWAFTESWELTEWNNWAECWVRIKLDCAHHLDAETLVVTDYKTGKFRDDQNETYMSQLELYALSAMLQMPHVTRVLPRLLYLDHGVSFPQTALEYTREDIPRLQKIWATRVKPMFLDTRFAPKPNRFCSYCHFSSSKGGPCQY
jgi:PD-(D/E)XK nuclease superfamily